MRKLSFALALAAAFGAAPSLAQNSPGQPGKGLPYVGNGAAQPSFGGDVYFDSGRPWCDIRAKGALQDGATDDHAAFAACKTVLDALGGGTIFVPPSPTVTCNKSVFTVDTTPIRILGAAIGGGPDAGASTARGSTISACGADTAVINLNVANSVIENIHIIGDTSVLVSAGSSALILGSSCTSCIVLNSSPTSGYYNIQALAVDYVLDNVTTGSAYGPAQISSSGLGGFHKRVKTDQGWPVATPAQGITTPAWAGTTGYSTGNYVTSGGWVLYARVGGTSGGVAPTLVQRGVDIVDGTVTWRLVNPTVSYAIEVSAGEFYSEHGDFTGPFSTAIHVTGAGTEVTITDAIISQSRTQNILVDNGTTFILANSRVLGCWLTGCSGGVVINGSFAGVPIIIGNKMGVQGTNIEYDAGGGLVVNGNWLLGGFGTGIGVKVGTANLSNIAIVGNVLGQSGSTLTTGVSFTAGTSDYVSVRGNACQFSTTCFSGAITGAHNGIEANGSIIAGLVKLPIASGTTSTLAQNTTDYLGMAGGFATNQLPAITAPFAGTLKNLSFNSGTTPAAGQTLTITLMTGTYAAAVAGTLTASAVTCQIANPAVACQDNTNSVAIAANSVFVLRTVTSATSGTITGASWGLEFDSP